MEGILEQENAILRTKVDEMEADLFTRMDTPSGTPTTSSNSTPSKSGNGSKCSVCGGSRSNCPQCQLLREASLPGSGVVGSLKQQVAVGRMMRKEERIVK